MIKANATRWSTPVRLLKLALLPFLLPCIVGIASAKDAEPTNLLLIVVDDLGYGDLGSYGHPVIQTPHLDDLADKGIRFTQYYSASALCSPSRAAMLTGRHPYRTGIQSWIPADSGVYLRDREITLAELLKAQNYQTALIGKWHLNSDLGSKSEPQPTDQGFDYFYGHNAFQTPTNKNPDNLYRNRDPLPVQTGFTADLFAEESIAWLSARDPKRPFFLMLSMAEPHTPIENPDEVNALYREHTMGDIVPIPSGGPSPPKALLKARGPGEYYANVTYMDQGIGQVIDFIDAAEIRSSTLIIFVSDNGPVTDDWINWWEVNAYGATGGYRGRKHYLYEGGIRVPAIISQPGRLPEGQVSNAMFTGTDWLATLAGLLSFDIPTDRPIDSVDVARDWMSDVSTRSTSVHWSLPTPNGLDHVIRMGELKLILDQDLNPMALYDLAEDPFEMFDLRAEMPERVSELVKQHRAYMASVENDPLRPK